MKVVIDTNVFISSFFGGKPRKVIDLWKRGDIKICLSPGIVEEYVTVLRRLGLEEDPLIGELLDLLAKAHSILFAAQTPALRIIQEDPGDDKFVACAVALKADVIISGDKHLRDMGDYMGIKVLGPAEFLTFFQQRR
jgi:putative PIN family toxin of toxin-antitoxin system